MTERNYKVEIVECSKPSLSARERVKLKDVSAMTKLDVITAESDDVLINPDYYAELNVTNSASEQGEYKVYVVVDKNGTMFTTGSDSFYTAFRDIFDEMDGTGEEYEISCYRQESKNYKGKSFITCTIV